VNHFYFETVGPYWPPERTMIQNEYRDLPFPFAIIPAPQFRIEAHWSLEQLTGYLRTWSATQKFIAAQGYDPVAETERALRKLWDEADAQRLVVWPLLLRVGRAD
jgi:hypothetical protein